MLTALREMLPLGYRTQSLYILFFTEESEPGKELTVATEHDKHCPRANDKTLAANDCSFCEVIRNVYRSLHVGIGEADRGDETRPE